MFDDFCKLCGVPLGKITAAGAPMITLGWRDRDAKVRCDVAGMAARGITVEDRAHEPHGPFSDPTDDAQRLLGYMATLDIDWSALTDPERHPAIQRALFAGGEVRTAESPGGVFIERLAFFDHDYMGWHLLAQVWDHDHQETAKWRCMLFFGDGGGIEVVYEWPEFVWLLGKYPLVFADSLEDAELARFVALQQYVCAARLPGDFFAFVMVTVTGNGRLALGTFDGMQDAYCYESVPVAMLALHAWDGTGEPNGWHRHVQSGRRRPGGDPAKEYVSQ